MKVWKISALKIAIFELGKYYFQTEMKRIEPFTDALKRDASIRHEISILHPYYNNDQIDSLYVGIVYAVEELLLKRKLQSTEISILTSFVWSYIDDQYRENNIKPVSAKEVTEYHLLISKIFFAMPDDALNTIQKFREYHTKLLDQELDRLYRKISYGNS